jgi:hypothetical protein
MEKLPPGPDAETCRKAAAVIETRERSYVYLASPYSHPDKAVMQKRFEDVCAAASGLMSRGALVFSPIAHTHPIAVSGCLPRGWDFWKLYDEVMIGHAEKVVVLTLEGWRESKGVAAEIEIAKQLGIPVEYSTEQAAKAKEKCDVAPHD